MIWKDNTTPKGLNKHKPFNVDIILFQEHYKSLYRLNGHAWRGSPIIVIEIAN